VLTLFPCELDLMGGGKLSEREAKIRDGGQARGIPSLSGGQPFINSEARGRARMSSRGGLENGK